MTKKDLTIEQYFKSELRDYRPYAGQLTPKFQAALELYHRNVKREDCYFYHSLDLPNGETIKGDWDLRGYELDYLGHVDLKGKTLIEYGPASGYLSQTIAKAGADLTVFDLPIGSGPEIMPFFGRDLEEVAQDGAHSVGRLRNSWWYAKAAFGFSARAVYADIYHQPADLGEYDIAFFGAILVHLSNPFLALREAAMVARETMIVTDLIALGPNDDVPGMMQIGTTAPPIGHIHWWNYSVSAFRVMLERLGFGHQSVYLHAPSARQGKAQMATIVAHRS